MEELSDADITIKAREVEAAGSGSRKARPKKYDQLDLEQITLSATVNETDIIQEIKEIDIGTMTPVDALNTLYRLQNKLKNRW